MPLAFGIVKSQGPSDINPTMVWLRYEVITGDLRRTPWLSVLSIWSDWRFGLFLEHLRSQENLMSCRWSLDVLGEHMPSGICLRWRLVWWKGGCQGPSGVSHRWQLALSSIVAQYGSRAMIFCVDLASNFINVGPQGSRCLNSMGYSEFHPRLTQVRFWNLPDPGTSVARRVKP